MKYATLQQDISEPKQMIYLGKNSGKVSALVLKIDEGLDGWGGGSGIL